jgi:hypothetical protein
VLLRYPGDFFYGSNGRMGVLLMAMCFSARMILFS